MSFEEDSIKDMKSRLIVVEAIAAILLEGEPVSSRRIRERLLEDGIDERVFISRTGAMLKSAVKHNAIVPTGKTEPTFLRSTRDKPRSVKVYTLTKVSLLDKWVDSFRDALNDTVMLLANMTKQVHVSSDDYGWMDRALCAQVPWAQLDDREKRTICLECEVFFECRQANDKAEDSYGYWELYEIFAGENGRQRVARRKSEENS